MTRRNQQHSNILNTCGGNDSLLAILVGWWRHGEDN